MHARRGGGTADETNRCVTHRVSLPGLCVFSHNLAAIARERESTGIQRLCCNVLMLINDRGLNHYSPHEHALSFQQRPAQELVVVAVTPVRRDVGRTSRNSATARPLECADVWAIWYFGLYDARCRGGGSRKHNKWGLMGTPTPFRYLYYSIRFSNSNCVLCAWHE